MTPLEIISRLSYLELPFYADTKKRKNAKKLFLYVV